MGCFFEELDDMTKGFELGNYSRADLIYYITQALEKAGLDRDDISQKILYEMGQDSGARGKKSLGIQDEGPDAFISFMTRPGLGSKVYGMEVVKLDKEQSIAHFHHCQLVERWKQLGLDEEKIDYLCNLANQADLGRAGNFKNVELTFPKRIGAGDEYCELNAVYKES
jgi:hypothetical protein